MSARRDLEVADTLPPENGAAAAPAATAPAAAPGEDTTVAPEPGIAGMTPTSSPPPGGHLPSGGAPPITDWDRYELLDLLGEGGMGSVYRARDLLLGRLVAIKLIRGADPNLTLRLVREATALARIEHPNICPIYDAGVVQGRAFLALRLVEGEPLRKAAAQMSLDDKVAALRDVAAAVHAAHQHDIVHRDLKPANVLVERTDDGRWFPIVMDFGLAREATADAGLTESGMLIGTAAYMSPEQARGDVHAVDARTDVYGLGATLYELLTGSVPFPSTSTTAAIAHAIHDDPRAPRSLVPGLPVELETIALKCLAKEPAQRYPSARALADDLGRYLAGEPILGRRQSLWQRARRRARRHRALVVLGACSLAAIAALIGLGIHDRVLADRRARLTEQLSREATEIEGALREAYLLPLHDIRGARALVRDRMRAIATMHPDLGELGDAIVHTALGRGHLALHEWREAADELGRAAEGGLQSPELHLARGRALGELYRRALENARRAGDATWLARRQDELAQQYLPEVRRELGGGRAPGEGAALLDARLALYRREFAAAELQAQAIADRAPQLLEAFRLAADAAYAAAVEDFDRGKYGAARLGLMHAAELYRQAIDRARSDPSLYQAAAETQLRIAELDYRDGPSPRAALTRAIDLLDGGALVADPAAAAPYATKAHVLLRWYRTPSLYGPDDRPALLDRIAAAGARAVDLDRSDPSAWTVLGHAHVYRAIYDMHHGGEGDVCLNRALDEFDHALAIQRDDPQAHNGTGTAHRWLGTSLYRAARDPMPEYQAARDSYQWATDLDPHYVAACGNQADIYMTIAEYQMAVGDDPRPALDTARRTATHCLTIDDRYYLALENLAQAEIALARYLVEHERAPRERVDGLLRDARSALDRDERVHPGNMASQYHLLTADVVDATHQLRNGGDPAAVLEAGRAKVQRALHLAPETAMVYIEAARLDLIDAAMPAHAGRGAAAALARARDTAERATLLDVNDAGAWLVAAEAYLAIATAQPRPDTIEIGLDRVDSALHLNPRLIAAHTVRAELVRLRGP